MIELSFTTALLIGFLGSTHCLGMCCGLSSVLAVDGGRGNQFRLLSYNLGRLCTYGSIGAMAGLLGSQVSDIAPLAGVFMRTVAGLLLVAMGLYVSQWWMGLSLLEQSGARLWKIVQPLSRFMLPVRSNGQALQLGVVWGLLPCGLVYSTLGWAVSAAHWQQSALIMLAFGVGTLPAMLSAGLINQHLLHQLHSRKIRVLAGVLIIGMGVVTVILPWMHMLHSSQPHH